MRHLSREWSTSIGIPMSHALSYKYLATTCRQLGPDAPRGAHCRVQGACSSGNLVHGKHTPEGAHCRAQHADPLLPAHVRRCSTGLVTICRPARSPTTIPGQAGRQAGRQAGKHGRVRQGPPCVRATRPSSVFAPAALAVSCPSRPVKARFLSGPAGIDQSGQRGVEDALCTQSQICSHATSSRRPGVTREAVGGLRDGGTGGEEGNNRKAAAGHTTRRWRARALAWRPARLQSHLPPSSPHRPNRPPPLCHR